MGSRGLDPIAQLQVRSDLTGADLRFGNLPRLFFTGLRALQTPETQETFLAL